MKKILCILMYISLTFLIFANISAVMFNNLPQEESFQNKFEFFLSDIQYMRYYIPNWEYPFTKNELIDRTLEFNSIINEQINPSYDLGILQLILLRYLYNLDAENVIPKIEAKAAELKEQSPADYRAPWIYANFLVSTAAYTTKGMYEFMYITEKMGNLTFFHPAFLEDYTYACMLTSMYKNGLIALEVAADLREIEITDYRQYETLKNMLQKPDVNTDYSEKETWSIKEFDEHYKMTSHILGVSIPLHREWNLKFFGLKEKQSFVMITPPKIRPTKGTDIGISLLFQFVTKDISYEEFVNGIKSSVPVIKEEEREINGILFKVFEFESENQYQHIGGARGYYVTAEISPTKYSNCNIEFPYMPSSSDKDENGLKYFPLTKGLDRIDQKVYLGILLDSCNDIFSEASNLFWGLIDISVFE